MCNLILKRLYTLNFFVNVRYVIYIYHIFGCSAEMRLVPLIIASIFRGEKKKNEKENIRHNVMQFPRIIVD